MPHLTSDLKRVPGVDVEFMNKIVVSASVMALGAASLNAMYAPELGRLETSKPWTVSAALRGFYDDNWSCYPRSQASGINTGSWGFEARPYIGLNFPMEQTFFGFSYLNSSRYYEARDHANGEPWDFAHEVTLKFDHVFSPRYRVSVNDTFTYGQEPDTTGIITAQRRGDLSYIHNAAAVNFFGTLTEQFGVTASYNNGLWNYFDSGADSYSAKLDRIEQSIPVALRWQAQPDLVAMVGYTLNLASYTGNSYIDQANGSTFRSEDRDSISHVFFLGGDYDINGQLRASARGGVQYTTYQNRNGEDQWTPYADCSLSYTYTVGSHADLGFRHTMSATDLAVANGTSPTLDQEASAIYLNIDHQFSPKLSANLLAQYQFSTFHSGAANNFDEQYFLLGLYANYDISDLFSMPVRTFSVEAGYNFDYLTSGFKQGGIDLRGYDRNRIFLGFRASL